MKKTLGLLALSAALLTTGCLQHEPYPHEGSFHINQRAENALGALVVFNKNEMKLARLAKAKTSNTLVRRYATMIYNDHGQNLRSTVALAHKLNLPLHKDATALSLQHTGAVEWQHLDHSSHFNREFADVMVKGHEDGLRLMDHLISRSKNPEVRQHLKTTKAHVYMHLEKARALQAALAR